MKQQQNKYDSSLLTYIQHNHVYLNFSTRETSSPAILLDCQIDKALNGMKGRIIVNKNVPESDYQIPVLNGAFSNGEISFSYKEKSYSSKIKFKPSGDEFSRETGIYTRESINRVYDIFLNGTIQEEGKEGKEGVSIQVQEQRKLIPFQMTVSLAKVPVVHNFAENMILDKTLEDFDKEIFEIMQKLNPSFFYTAFADSRKYFGNFCVVDKRDNFYPIVYLKDIFIYSREAKTAFNHTMEKEMYRIPDLFFLQEFHEKKNFSFDYPKMMSFPFSYEIDNEKNKEFYAFLIISDTGPDYSKSDLYEKEIYYDQLKMFRDIHQYVYVKQKLIKEFQLNNYSFTPEGQFLELVYKGSSESDIIHFVKALDMVKKIYSCNYTIDLNKLQLNQKEKGRIRPLRTIDGKNVAIHEYKVNPETNEITLMLKFNLKDHARKRLYTYIRSLIT